MYWMSGSVGTGWARGSERRDGGGTTRARGRRFLNILLNHASAHAASASAIAAVVVAARALETTLDQPEHAMWFAPDMYMDMLDMSCALSSQFMATECSIAFCSAADLLAGVVVYMYL